MNTLSPINGLSTPDRLSYLKVGFTRDHSTLNSKTSTYDTRGEL